MTNIAIGAKPDSNKVSLPKIRVGWRVATRVLAELGRLNIGLLSAGVAFYALLAIFPALTAVIALWGLFADPEVVQAEVATFEPLIPEAAYDIIAAQIHALASGPPQTLGWATMISLGAALWATRSGVAALVRGLNAAYEVPARRGLLPTIWAMMLTVVLIAIALVALATVLLVPIALAFVPLGLVTTQVLNLLRWVIGIGVVLLGIGLLYRFGPNRPSQGKRLISLGAIVSVALWGAVSVGFSAYLTNFGNYDAVYGSLGAVIALLMWFYLSAFVVMFGALLNAAIERGDSLVIDQPVSDSVDEKNIA